MNAPITVRLELDRMKLTMLCAIERHMATDAIKEAVTKAVDGFDWNNEVAKSANDAMRQLVQDAAREARYAVSRHPEAMQKLQELISSEAIRQIREQA